VQDVNEMGAERVLHKLGN